LRPDRDRSRQAILHRWLTTPRLWSDKQLAVSRTSASYDLAADGKRIAALMLVDTPEWQQAQNHVIFLMNFADELRRKVPMRK
jgi:hypothetical protein